MTIAKYTEVLHEQIHGAHTVFEDWLKAKGIDPEDLSESHLALWRKEFDALQPKTAIAPRDKQEDIGDVTP